MRAVVVFLSLSAAVSCGGTKRPTRPTPAVLKQHCEAGTYTDSSAACGMLVLDAKTDEEREALRVLEAKNELHTCSDPTSSTCQGALDTLYKKGVDLEVCVSVWEQGCKKHDVASCRHASSAYWEGRGAPAQPLTSLSWHVQCGEACGAFDPDLYTVEDAEKTFRLERLSILVKARAYDTVLALVEKDVGRGKLEKADSAALLREIVNERTKTEVEPLVAKGPSREALGAIERLIAITETPQLAAAREQVRAGLAAPELNLHFRASAAKLPLTAHHYAKRAAMYGGLMSVPAAPQPDWSQLLTRPTVTGLDSSCDFVRSRLAETYPASGANVQLSSTLKCAFSTSKRTRTERYTKKGTRSVKRTRTIKGKGCTTFQSICDSNNSFQGKTCYETRCDPDREETYYEDEEYEEPMTREVSYSVEEVTLRGALTGSTGTVDFENGGSGSTMGRSDAYERIISGIERINADVRRAQAKKELEAARTAATPLARFEHVLRAENLGAGPAEMAAALGISNDEMYEMMRTTVGELPVPAKLATTVEVPETEARTAFDASKYPTPTGAAVLGKGPYDGDPVPGEGDGAGAWFKRGMRVDMRYLAREPAMEGGQSGTGYGVGIERSTRFEDTWITGFELNAGHDSTYGTMIDTRVIVGSGLRFGPLGIGYGVGAGYGRIGILVPGGMTDTASGFDVFHGPDLSLALGEKLRAHGRMIWTFGGPFDSETRTSGEVMYLLRRGSEIGVGVTNREFDSGDSQLSAGLSYRFRRF